MPAIATRLDWYCVRVPVVMQRLTHDRREKAVMYQSDKSGDSKASTEALDTTARTWAQHAWQVDGKAPEATYRTIIDHLQQAESLTRP